MFFGDSIGIRASLTWFLLVRVNVGEERLPRFRVTVRKRVHHMGKSFRDDVGRFCQGWKTRDYYSAGGFNTSANIRKSPPD